MKFFLSENDTKPNKTLVANVSTTANLTKYFDTGDTILIHNSLPVFQKQIHKSAR